MEIGHTFYSWSTFIGMEAGFLLYVLSSACISWYIFSTLFTIFWPIKSTPYSVFYRGGIFGHDITMTGHRGQKRSLPVCFFPLNQDPTFYPSRSSDFLAPSEFWPPGCNFSHVITCVRGPESGYWGSRWDNQPKAQCKSSPNPKQHVRIKNRS